jgi:hypothetical protein
VSRASQAARTTARRAPGPRGARRLSGAAGPGTRVLVVEEGVLPQCRAGTGAGAVRPAEAPHRPTGDEPSGRRARPI